jgi:hypothetical protein
VKYVNPFDAVLHDDDVACSFAFARLKDCLRLEEQSNQEQSWTMKGEEANILDRAHYFR